MANQIEVEIVLEDGSVKKGLVKAEKQAKKSGRSIGESLDQNIGGRLLKSFAGVATKVAAVGATIASVFGGLAVRAASRQEEAVKQLNTQLQLAGTFSRETSREFQALAEQMQENTRFSDELITKQLALARAYTQTNDQAKNLVTAAADLAAATGRDLDFAVENLGATFAGTAGELEDFVPEIGELSLAALKSGDAIQLVADRFGGAAQKNVKTFSGATSQLGNSFNNLLEQFGNIVVESPAAIDLMNKLADSFNSLSDSLESSLSGGEFKSLIVTMSNVGQAIVTFVVSPIELAVNAIGTLINTLAAGLAGAVASIMKIPEGLARLADFVGLEGGLTKGIIDASEAVGNSWKKESMNARESMEEILDFPFSQKANGLLEEIKVTAKRAGDSLDRGISDGSGSAVDKVALDWEAIIQKTKDAFSRTEVTAQQFASTIKNSFASGISDAFASVGQALGRGENAFAAFGQSVLKTIGTLAIQLGQFFILLGTAQQASGLFPSAGAAIAAGIALTVLGGVLKGMAGGGGEQASGGGGGSAGATNTGGGGVSSQPGETTTLPEEEERQPQTKVDVNVQGNVLDRRETGLAIADVINETFDSNGVVIAGANS